MKLTFLFLLTVLGAGCAAKKMAVSNADILLENQIEKRLPLYQVQKDQLSKDVDKFLNDQKPVAKELIPLVNNLELDVNKVDSLYDHTMNLYHKMALNFSKLISKYMGQLDEKQQKDFAKNLKEENDRMSRADKEERMEKLNDRFETLFGTMSDKQRAILNKEIAFFEARHANRMKKRELLHLRFKKVFEMDVSPDSRAQSFYEAFSDFQSPKQDAEKIKEIIKALIPTLSPEQRTTFKNKTKDLKEILGYYLEAAY